MKHKTKVVLEWVIFSFLSLVLVLALSLFFYQKAYAGKIYYNTEVAGLDVSGKTKGQLEYILNNKIESLEKKEIVLSANNQEVTVTVAESGLSIDVGSVLEDSYAIGRDSSFLNQLYKSAKTVFIKQKVEIKTVLDEEKFSSLISEKIPSLSIEPANAELKVEAGEIVEVTESEGQNVDTKNLEDEIIALIDEDETNNSFVINLATTPIEPEIKVADLAEAKTYANTALAKKVYLAYNGKTYSPSRTNIGNWLHFSVENGKYTATLDDNAIKTYLATVAQNFEIKRIDKKINASNNETIEEGRTGVYLDKTRALAEIKAQISNSNTIRVTLQTYEEAPEEVKVFPAEGIVPGRYEGKYIDIDLSQQQLCMIETNNVLGCYMISSGKASMPTPTGTRFIQSKHPKAWSAKYGLYMPFWQAMGGGYGIHELPEWPSGYKEGENHLGIPVSHGCVRLGVGPAATLYNWSEIGTPVYIHK